MKIGFDLDGVITRSAVEIWILAKKDIELKKLFTATLRPVLLPQMFAAEGDELCIITAREEELREVTADWCHKYFPNIPLHQVILSRWKSQRDWDLWRERIAVSKAKIINKLELDVYIEDIPQTVHRLRELCPNTKIIQYGGRVR